MNNDRLEGWKEIANHIQKSEKTARRWERLGMPVRRMKGPKGPIISAFRGEIEAWREARERKRKVAVRIAKPSEKAHHRPDSGGATGMGWSSLAVAVVAWCVVLLSASIAGVPSVDSQESELAGAALATLSPREPTSPANRYTSGEEHPGRFRGVPPLYFDPVAHYRFDEVDGNIARDISGNLHDAYIRGATRVRGVSGDGALSFDGKRAFVFSPNAPGLDVRGAVTLEAVLMCERGGDGAFLPVVRKRQPGVSDTGYSMSVSAECSLTSFVGSPRLPVGEWHHIAVQYDGTMARMYLDSALLAEAPPGRAHPATASVADLFIGGSAVGGHSFFKGAIDELRVSRGIVRPRDFIPFCPGRFVKLIGADGRTEVLPHIQAAIDRAEAGDRILVGTGTYPERLRIRHKVDLEIVSSCGAQLRGGIDIETSRRVVVKGFNVDATGMDTGILVSGADGKSETILILDSVVHSALQDGIFVTGRAVDIQIDGNEIYENRRHGVFVDAPTGEHFKLRYNLIYGNGADGANFARSQNILVSENTIRDQTSGYAIGRQRFAAGTRTRHLTLGGNELINNGGTVTDSVSSADLQNYDQYLDVIDQGNVTTCGCERPSLDRYKILDGWILIEKITLETPTEGSDSG